MDNKSTDKIYEINNMYISRPDVFGPGRWDILHSYSSLCKTPEKKKEFASFVENVFAPTIRCLECRNHFLAMLEKYPVPYGSRPHPEGRQWNDNDSVFKWSYSVHNIVNQRLNKPIISWDICQKLYNPDALPCTQCYHTF